MAQSPCGFEPRLNGSRPTDTRHYPGLVYSPGTKGWPLANVKHVKVKLLDPGVQV
ncbi:hypothetical protein SCLCIDRAFT_22564 [Scleroderma citrinum Foug A]|uniref:Uncharacterized protein n=1 Tax=Scleroderma citrinum Foug A TaxID=1036808 RepID=A0A0C3EBI1_9AGAM|nr:hypothetical protein SCLCIDRAFT_22564 [Scleroderma citrinum Foug A]